MPRGLGCLFRDHLNAPDQGFSDSMNPTLFRGHGIAFPTFILPNIGPPKCPVHSTVTISSLQGGQFHTRNSGSSLN